MSVVPVYLPFSLVQRVNDAVLAVGARGGWATCPSGTTLFGRGGRGTRVVFLRLCLALFVL